MNKRTIYISDILAIPNPTHARSRKDYLRKLRNRRILCTLLPLCIEAAGMLSLVALTVFGAGFFAVGLGV